MAALLQQAQMDPPGEVVDNLTAFMNQNSFDVGGNCIFEVINSLRSPLVHSILQVTPKIEVRWVEVQRIGCPFNICPSRDDLITEFLL